MDAVGKVGRLVHNMDIEAGSATTDVTLLISIANALAITDPDSPDSDLDVLDDTETSEHVPWETSPLLFESLGATIQFDFDGLATGKTDNITIDANNGSTLEISVEIPEDTLTLKA